MIDLLFRHRLTQHLLATEARVGACGFVARPFLPVLALSRRFSLVDAHGQELDDQVGDAQAALEFFTASGRS
jgi:hypothetical protein